MKTTLLSGLLLAGALAVPLTLPLAVRAQPAKPALQLPATAKSTEMTPAQAMKAFALNDPTNATVAVVPVKDARFVEALRATNTRQPSNDYNIQAIAPIESAVKKGDVMLATFWMRTIVTTDETGQGSVGFVFERAGDPYTKSAVYVAHAGEEWKQFQVPFVAAEDYEAGKANMLLRFGYMPQTVEVANFTLANYGDTLKVEQLPRTAYSYAGQNADAPWRREAAARIDKIRKADMIVRVVDAQGKPVKGANVSIEETRGAYPFGSAISASNLFNPAISDADKAKYRQVFQDNFGFAVIENGLKWQRWEDPQRRTETLYTAGWLNGNQIPLRGHVLVWPSWKNSPRDLQGLKDTPDALRKRIADHIGDEVGAMRGLVTHWDVINEPFDNHDIMDALGREVMVDWFKAARAADPNARLYINDYAILSGGTRDTDHQKHYEQTIQFLKDNGAPIGGIGLQGHIGENYTPPTQLWKVLDRFGKLGLPITVTEFDIDSTDEAAQADYMRDFLTAMFAHEATDGVMMWGFWEGSHWKPNAALWRKDWTLKPAGEAWLKLVKDEWTTRASGATDARGEAKVRGFKGDYRVTVERGGRFVDANATLGKDGDVVVVKLG